MSYRSTTTDAATPLRPVIISASIMPKIIENVAIQRVQYTTDLPVYEVLKRLDAAVNRDAEKNIVRSIRAARTPKDLELRVKEVAGDDFG